VTALTERPRDQEPVRPGGFHPLRRAEERRRGTREFRPIPLPAKQLGSILTALSLSGNGYPPPLRCYPLLLNIEHELNGRACRYEPAGHALQDVGPCPSWPELAPMLGAAATPGVASPHFVFVFILADEPLIAKYGTRGNRYGLIEIGAAVQSVSLRLAAERMSGHLLGGTAEEPMLDLLGLARLEVRLAAVLAGGLPSP
jgi:hypothetical protein